MRSSLYNNHCTIISSTVIILLLLIIIHNYIHYSYVVICNVVTELLKPVILLGTIEREKATFEISNSSFDQIEEEEKEDILPEGWDMRMVAT